MKKAYTLLIFCILITVTQSYAQSEDASKRYQIIDLAGTVGNSKGSTALSYAYNWRFGKKRKLEAGLGMRLTSSFGRKLDFITAGPARLTRSFSTPFIIFFAGQETQNWDTITVQRPVINALNFTINLGYNFNSRLFGGFNIDLIGASVGRKSASMYHGNGINSAEPVTNPAALNLLLTGDHDRGSLNSEFFLRYQLNSNWSVRAIYQFLFTEYQTTSIQQIASDGTRINRFRNKANNFGLGVSYKL